ncbi:hypothetical protein BaRGS_00036366 [Batillaria attramentaria]|uniref:WAP domain-containing protein n=1 Tax=Batillaria attramentaria TaxID=370345 RepID=A0ABD0JC90_9CAEN
MKLAVFVLALIVLAAYAQDHGPCNSAPDPHCSTEDPHAHRECATNNDCSDDGSKTCCFHGCSSDCHHNN